MEPVLRSEVDSQDDIRFKLVGPGTRGWSLVCEHISSVITRAVWSCVLRYSHIYSLRYGSSNPIHPEPLSWGGDKVNYWWMRGRT